MATSGARLQLAIAPAGSGKTTAMSALATAWRNGAGTVVGLAPSAAAAAQLGAQIDTHADTLALLTHALDHRLPLPVWAGHIGPTSLVIIDAAGMADTRRAKIPGDDLDIREASGRSGAMPRSRLLPEPGLLRGQLPVHIESRVA